MYYPVIDFGFGVDYNRSTEKVLFLFDKQDNGMSTIYIEPAQKAGEVLYLVKSAVESEMARFELAIDAAQKRLAPFEQK